MKTITVENGVTLLTRNVENILFESMWEMPSGVTLNSYIVKGEDTAVIDGFCGWDGYPESLFKLLKECDVELESIKYVVVNHVEPDHSGWLEDFKKIHSNFTIYCTREAKSLLEMYYGEFENIIAVKNGEELDLGGRVLEFIKTPNVHWPDTMMTFDRDTGTLFSCDCFGSFGKLEKNIDSEMKAKELDSREDDRIRYYSNILGLFSMNVSKAISQIKNYDVRVVAPGHGIVYKKDIDYIIDRYEKYASYQRNADVKNALIIWGSMYGVSEATLPIIEKELKKKGYTVESLNAESTDIGTLLMKAWSSGTIVVVAPTYEMAMFPPVAAAVDELCRKKLQGRELMFFGSCGWSGGALRELKQTIERYRLKWEMKAEYEFKGAVTKEVEEKIISLISEK